MRDANKILTALGLMLFLSGAIALGYFVFILGGAHLYQRNAELNFEKSTPAPGVEVAERLVAPGFPFARFEIPRLNVNVMVIEGDSDDELSHGAGHVPGTALPGNVGNVGIAAHRDTYFRPLRDIRVGDILVLKTAGTTYEYAVKSTEIVAPDQSEVLNRTKDRQLTLVTCYPFYYIGSAPKRFIVHASEIEEDQTATVGQ
jgi:sortase A